MILVSDEADIEPTKGANPTEAVLWVRSDGTKEIHRPWDEPVTLLLPRPEEVE